AGLVRPERVTAYAEKGLEYPLDPGQTMRLYVYLGDALQVANHKKPFVERRKLAVMPYLRGLKDIRKYNLPTTPPDLPAVSRYHVPRNDPMYAELERQ